MAEKNIVLLLCDMCGAEPAERFVIGHTARSRVRGKQVDLCAKHAKPIQDAAAYGSGPELDVHTRVARSRAAQRPGPETKIFTQEELDQMEE